MELQSGIVQILQRIPWFHELASYDLERLSKITNLSHLRTGDILFTEGEPENGLFVLMEGQIALETHAPMYGSVQIFTAEPLDIIGWSSLTPVVRQHTDTARALTDCLVVGFNSGLLRQFCDDDPTFGYLIMRRIANVAASRLLTTRLHLFEVIREQSEKIQAHN